MAKEEKDVQLDPNGVKAFVEAMGALNANMIKKKTAKKTDTKKTARKK